MAYNLEFCNFKECTHLEGDACNNGECIFKMKRIKYWERTGEWPWVRQYELEGE